MDHTEAKLKDSWVNAKHQKYGRVDIKATQIKYKTIPLKEQLEKMKVNTKLNNQYKKNPKPKPFDGKVDRTKLKEL